MEKSRIKGVIAIDRELCKGCAYCVMACPKKCIDIDKGFNAAGYFPAHFSSPESCTGCAVCAGMCPEIAIEVWRAE
ncbi:MAG: 4Fe-4S dicluster domain-containing protein [Nitrospirales bacterium]|nr:4Fe-4S dicluster domain-containing protein [Nitrospirales bacterium]